MVVLTLKNLQQKTFNVEIDISASVKELKEKIEKENGAEYPADGQKLIYAGKILHDDNILETYNIDVKKFLVIMVTKPKTPLPSTPTDFTVPDTEQSSTSEPTPTTAPSTTVPSTTAPSTTAPSTTSSTSTTTTTSSAPSTATEGTADNAESLIVVGDDYNKMVENIMEMGYEKAQVERALSASFNNPYTAVQYLVDGIPSNIDFGSSSGPNPVARQGTDDAAAPAEGGDVEGDPLEFLRSQPQFNQMRQMIRSNPQLLDAFVQQIGQSNPELLRVIQQNQEAFVRMLNEGNPPTGTAASTGGSTAGSGSGGTAAAPTSGSRSASDPNAILVSPQDRDAIQRLKTLGNFPEDVVIQAYFACEKNENLAAEFLFSQSWD